MICGDLLYNNVHKKLIMQNVPSCTASKAIFPLFGFRFLLTLGKYLQLNYITVNEPLNALYNRLL